MCNDYAKRSRMLAPLEITAFSQYEVIIRKIAIDSKDNYFRLNKNGIEFVTKYCKACVDSLMFSPLLQ